MRVNGTLINYYFHCKRQCYLHGNRLNLEDNSEQVKIGKVIHEEKAYSQVMLAQAQNADTRLTRRDIDMLLDRLQTANPESAQVAGTTDDEFRQKFAALVRKKVGERPPEE